MAFTPRNSTAPIKAFTFTGTAALNLGVDVLALADPTGTSSGVGLIGMCTALQIQNLTTDTILVLESASATKGINIPPNVMWAPPQDTNGNGYDVFEFWLKSAAGAGDVIVFRKVA
jgi:hypothetical protein